MGDFYKIGLDMAISSLGLRSIDFYFRGKIELLQRNSSPVKKIEPLGLSNVNFVAHLSNRTGREALDELLIKHDFPRIVDVMEIPVSRGVKNYRYLFDIDGKEYRIFFENPVDNQS